MPGCYFFAKLGLYGLYPTVISSRYTAELSNL